MNDVKERPILFSGPMVRAILEGRKTQTRRVVKLTPKQAMEPQPEYGLATVAGFTDEAPVMRVRRSRGVYHHVDRKSFCEDYAPWGVGDRLWVREAWRTSERDDCFKPRELMKVSPIWYECDGQPGSLVNPSKLDVRGRYRHARFMMRWMSRIMLEVVRVRVERLQEISEEDAKAEGAPSNYNPLGEPSHIDKTFAIHGSSYRFGFEGGWKSINGCDSWEANPWVWVVEFKRVQ